MKKSLFTIAAALLMIAATSCKKESINEPENSINNNREPEANEFLATVDGGMQQNAPAVNDGMGRMATFDGLKVMWQTGDVINVNNTTFTCNSDPENSNRAYFENGSAFHASHYHAFYSSTVSGMTITQQDSTKVSATLSATQTYDPAKLAANLPMYAYSTDHWLNFKNICGAIKISVPYTCDSIIVKNTSSAFNGAFTVVNDTAKMSNATPTDAEKKIKVIKNGNAKFIGCEAVYIAVPGGAYSGMEITFFDGGDIIFTTGQAAAGKKLVVTANKIFNLKLNLNNLLPRPFQVSDTKQVYFSKGDLFYNGSTQAFGIEAVQGLTTVPASWDANHVNHFCFCSNYANAVIPGSPKDNALFCAESTPISINGESGYYCLSKDEWQYLIDNASGRVQIGSTWYSVIAPVGKSISDITSTQSISDLTSEGYLILSTHGRYNGSDFTAPGYTIYWTSSYISNKPHNVYSKPSGTDASLALQIKNNEGSNSLRLRLVKNSK